MSKPKSGERLKIEWIPAGEEDVNRDSVRLKLEELIEEDLKNSAIRYEYSKHVISCLRIKNCNWLLVDLNLIHIFEGHSMIETMAQTIRADLAMAANDRLYRMVFPSTEPTFNLNREVSKELGKLLANTNKENVRAWHKPEEANLPEYEGNVQLAYYYLSLFVESQIISQHQLAASEFLALKNRLMGRVAINEFQVFLQECGVDLESIQVVYDTKPLNDDVAV